MINVSDLKVGNWVSTNGAPLNTHKEGVYEISAIYNRQNVPHGSKNLVCINTDNKSFGETGANCEDLEPIPLTEELLAKCGFELDAKNSKSVSMFKRLSKDDNFIFAYIENGNVEIEVGQDNGGDCGAAETNVKSLHQLQNLYFDLVGKEIVCEV